MDLKKKNQEQSCDYSLEVQIQQIPKLEEIYLVLMLTTFSCPVSSTLVCTSHLVIRSLISPFDECILSTDYAPTIYLPSIKVMKQGLQLTDIQKGKKITDYKVW